MRCIVIGGGAAGMMSAIAAAKTGAEVLLLEKNEKLGKKIYITGKGRCNVTNDCDPEDFFANIVTNDKFMYSAYYSFNNSMLMDMITSAGCDIKTERGNRVFPVSDHSSDITRALTNIMKDLGVQVRLNSQVTSLLTENGTVTGLKLKSGQTIDGDRVIVATGGLSYASTGSTGDGHKWLTNLGHTVKECKPALVPLTVEEDFYKDLQGLALKNVEVKLYDEFIPEGTIIPKKKKPIYEGFGEMLFTHFGISGPLIISASSYYAKKAYGKRVTLMLDLKPALSMEQLDKRILRDFEENANKSFKNAIGGLLPAKLIPVIIEAAGIDPDKAVNVITREERERLVNTLKGLRFTVTGSRDFNEAIITQGGINVKEVNPSTMESKLVKGLYIVGELLDVDALTGGVNLQVAWSTGHLAGTSINE